MGGTRRFSENAGEVTFGDEAQRWFVEYLEGFHRNFWNMKNFIMYGNIDEVLRFW